MKKATKLLLLLLSVAVIIVSWYKLDGLIALLISFVILGIWAIGEGDRIKMKNRNKIY